MPGGEREQSSELERAKAHVEDLRKVLDKLPIATAIRDRDGRFLYVNAAASPGYGLTPEQIIGRLDREVLPPGNDADHLLRADREVIDTGRSLTVPSQPFRTAEGREMVLHMLREPVTFDSTPAVLTIAMDVTAASALAADRRRADQVIAETQRLEGLGLMAGGIAHDFNNLLVGVLANTELALYDAVTERAKTLLQRVKSATNRLAGLTRQLLAYSGRGHVSIEPISLPHLVRETLDLLSATVPPHIQVRSSFADDVPYINGDRGQLTQVLMNLVINAAEAIGERGGSVAIAVRNEHMDTYRTASLAVRSVHGPMDYVCLEVSDDGPGMDEATRNRIFDPFFTTKGKKGRGLGLASVSGIVRAHHGSLQVDSEPGKGTRMRVWFPPAHERARVALATAKVETLPFVHGKRVLIIDDEAVVREATRELLEARGFVALTAVDGADGLETVKRIGPVDVALVDMMMPGPKIGDVHKQLRIAVPDLPILLTSGYSEPDVLSRLLEEPNTQFIEKPFAMDELCARLQQMLAA